MLACRAGARLRTLVIDEESASRIVKLERLVEVIKAIQHEFAKIIVITHLCDLKNAFDTHLEVKKDPVRVRGIRYYNYDVVQQYITRLTTAPPTGRRLHSHLTLSARQSPVALPAPFPPWLSDLLQAQGIQRLAPTKRKHGRLETRKHLCVQHPLAVAVAWYASLRRITH